MIEIKINGRAMQLLEPIDLDSVESLIINTDMFPTYIRKEFTYQVTDWIYNIAMKADMVWYCGVLIDKAGIKKWGRK